MREDKAKITECKVRVMDNFITKHLMDLYGLNPNILPYAFQFPRVPPGTPHPMYGFAKNFEKNEIAKDNDSINPKLEDFQQMYQKYASALFDMNFSEIIPPGHPLFTRKTSIETLQAEKDKLLKENLELKKHLEKLSKNNPQQK